MPLDHVKLVERIKTLKIERDRAVAQANAIAGALAEAEHTLELWDAPPAPIVENGKTDSVAPSSDAH